MAIGSAHILIDKPGGHQAKAGSVEQEIDALKAAMTMAAQDLTNIAETSDTMAEEILSFQIALLDDDALIEPALHQIKLGSTAQEGWRHALNAQIAEYAASDEAYFRARAEDLVDLRDRVDATLTNTELDVAGIPDGSIVIADTLTPSRFLAVDWQNVRGLALAKGSPSSHVAMLGRARGLPMVVDLENDLSHLTGGEQIVLDADAGIVMRGLENNAIDQTKREIKARALQLARSNRLLPLPAVMVSGERVSVCVNVDDPARLTNVPADHCDGVGLTRTEFLFHASADLPSEDAQFAVYAKILDWANGRPVTIRTLDAGGDKPIEGLTVEGEANPFLGLRGLRLSLVRPDIFTIQLRALARASALGPLKVMFPMVTTQAEFDRARSQMQAATASLEKAGYEVGKPAIGMMVEVPAAAIAIDSFDADFFSIGSNDLIQYVTAASRDSQHVADLYDPLNPAVLSLISRVVDHGRAAGKEVSVCGDMAAEEVTLTALLDCGVRSISVADVALARSKAVIASYGADT